MLNNEILTQPVWVDQPDIFDRMLKDLSQAPIIAIDTESNSLHAYQEQVCLIQFSTEHEDYLLDPLVLTDLSALAPIFANPAVEKVFHAAEYDLICLKRDFHFTFVNLFDTMIAGRILGRPSIGLSAMLQSEFGFELDKRFQRANWGQRPLTAAMLNYARQDSRYLIALRHRMLAALKTAGLWDLAVEDFKRMAAMEVTPSDDEREPFWRVAGGHYLQPQQAAVLQEVYAFRDSQSQRMDLPSFKVFANQILLDIAINCPRNRDELYNCGLRGRLLDRFGGPILQAVQRGMHNPHPPVRPASQRPDERVMNRLELLRNWRKQTAKRYGVESDVILPRDIMETIADKAPRTTEALAEIMKDLPYRLKQYGPQILSLFQPEK